MIVSWECLGFGLVCFWFFLVALGAFLITLREQKKTKWCYLCQVGAKRCRKLCDVRGLNRVSNATISLILFVCFPCLPRGAKKVTKLCQVRAYWYQSGALALHALVAVEAVAEARADCAATIPWGLIFPVFCFSGSSTLGCVPPPQHVARFMICCFCFQM